MKRLVLSLVVLLLLGNSSVVFAQFVVNGDVETFEGTFPPAGWAVSCNTTGYGCWAKTPISTIPNPIVEGTAGFSSNAAGNIYGDNLLDTSLITPSFSTVGFYAVNLEFSGLFYLYSGFGNICDLEYSTDGGSNWTTFHSWGDYGLPTEESIALPAGALGQPNVMLRWHRYTSSNAYYWAAVDNVRLTAPTPVSVPTMNELGMIIFMMLAGLGSVYYLRRQRRSVR